MSVRDLVKKGLIQKENRRYARILAARRVTYDQWLDAREREWGQTLEDCAEKISGGRGQIFHGFALFIVGEGRLADHAIKSIEYYFCAHPEAKLLYGDEDVWETNALSQIEKKSPWFKPDWSPDLLDSCLYFGNLVAVRDELLAQMPVERAGAAVTEVSARDGISCYHVMNLSRFESWLYRCICAAGGYAKGCRAAVGHVSRILFHAENEEEQKKLWRDSETLRQRRQEYVRDFRDGAGRERVIVSVVIPSKDNPEILRKCVRAVESTAQGLPFEILVVDNGSSPENREKINALTQDMAGVGVKISYLYRPMEFNFSRMCNMGAEAAAGDLLLFLNDDVELTQAGCLWELAALAHRDYTGAVGLKLLYPVTERIQHCGITNLPMGPVHKLQSLSSNNRYYNGFGEGWGNFLAVTAACLMVEKNKFQEAGGFSEELQVAFNDVDLCFRLYELGYYNLCVNSSFAYHCESWSRGDDESREKQERLLRERRLLYDRHPALEQCDPYYSVYLNREGLDVCVRPAYLTAGNEVQQVERFEKMSGEELRRFKQDACLMVRVEDFRRRQLIGWSLVLGDNNACYSKKILFKRVDVAGERRFPTDVYALSLREAYRPDLEENMPDQENVALGGFMLRILDEALPGGRYLVGMSAHNRVTGLQLVNWSNRVVEL